VVIEDPKTMKIHEFALFNKLTPVKQEKILDAAVEEFASKGYRSASMNNLVKAAGISKGSLFMYFRTKPDLFSLVVDQAVDMVKTRLKKVRGDTADLSFFARIEALLQSGFKFIDDHPLLARIYFQALHSGDAPFGREWIIRLHQSSRKFLAELILEGLQKGEIRDDINVERFAFLLNCLMETLLRSYYTEFLASGLGLYKGSPEELKQWISTSIDFIRRGMEAEDGSGDRKKESRVEASI
jgi:TetR/AcrR family transcriptional regulator